MHRFLEARVDEYMTQPALTVPPGTTVADLQQQFVQHDFNGFPVVDAGGRLLGVVTKLDVLKVFVFTTTSVFPPYVELARRRADEIMTSDVTTFEPETPLTRVLQALVDTRVKSFPVLDKGKVVGIIAREDVVRALRDASETD